MESAPNNSYEHSSDTSLRSAGATGFDLFKGQAMAPELINELVQSVERGAARIIRRTFTGETGKWAHSDWMKLLYQFRTFSITAVEAGLAQDAFSGILPGTRIS